MKRELERLIVPALGLATIGYALRCWWRGSHAEKRHPIGGFRCVECAAAMDELPEGRVERTRAFGRENGGEFVRGKWWTPDARARRGGL